MIVTWPIGVRLGLIVLASVLVQISFFSYVSVFGASPDIVPVVIASVGLLGGAVGGAVVGFATGLVLDAALLDTLGASSLVLIAVGYLAGRYRESFEIDSALAPALLAGGLALLAAAGFTAMQLTLGGEAAVSGLVVREIVVKGLFGFALMYPVYPLIRFALRPALVLEEPSTRRPIFRRSRSRTRTRSRGPRGAAHGRVRRASARRGSA